MSAISVGMYYESLVSKTSFVWKFYVPSSGKSRYTGLY